ncbi:MAG: cellulase family glycosylhydrolase [bacterium]|nr:cellulase family glycosylhydrolase [bacterium]
MVACSPAPPQNSSGLVAATFDPNATLTEITPFILPSATPLALERCTADSIDRALALIPDYSPSTGAFITIQNGTFWQSDRPYPIYGINYYPRDYPNHRFLTETDVPAIDFELDLMRVHGLNTLRIFIRYDDLFACEANGTIPRPDNLARLDQFIQLAGVRGYKLIIVLHHDPNWAEYPLYDMPPHITAQTEFIAKRYADEPIIMAYDIRDGGDADYRTYRKTAVLRWLEMMGALIKANAPNQLITASWIEDAQDTAGYVDFISFQHFGDIDSLRQKIAILKNIAGEKPILPSAVGYATYELDELGQRENVYRAIEAIQQNALAGWVIWTAFDYPLTAICQDPNCPAEDGPANRFGIWNTSYFPKRALDAIRLATGVAQEG